jgi:nicotinate-nucleotide adenylyltransferase
MAVGGSRLRRRIGLLGGSFNPAHNGHRHISLIALKALGLDAVWWLVSPQNPLKPAAGMAPFAERMARAAKVARHPRIHICDIEERLGTRYTLDSLTALGRRFPETRFVWLMGADNLKQISRWKHWQRIFSLVEIAVFDRPSYSLPALASKAAHRFAGRRLKAGAVRGHDTARLPAWRFVACPRHQASATAIRERRASAQRLTTRRPKGGLNLRES